MRYYTAEEVLRAVEATFNLTPSEQPQAVALYLEQKVEPTERRYTLAEVRSVFMRRDIWDWLDLRAALEALP